MCLMVAEYVFGLPLNRLLTWSNCRAWKAKLDEWVHATEAAAGSCLAAIFIVIFMCSDTSKDIDLVTFYLKVENVLLSL